MKTTILAATLMLCVLALAACGGANNASSSSSSSSGSGDSDKPSGPDLSTPAGAMKAAADAFGSGDFAKLDPLWAKSVTQEKKD
jgi:ABC-type phosphate transport system substrate-binding protein